MNGSSWMERSPPGDAREDLTLWPYGGTGHFPLLTAMFVWPASWAALSSRSVTGKSPALGKFLSLVLRSAFHPESRVAPSPP